MEAGMGTINFTIDGRSVSAERGETILQVARREGIYIPTMCYISKTTPCASCRMCVVEAEGVDGMVLSCNTPPTQGLAVITNTEALETERANIMRMYDVNHPLECGVCDKSGACDLQNLTLNYGVAEQRFTAKEQSRPIDHWGLINYDPALCIMCEKCVHVCNEVIGDDAIELKFGGYKSTIIPKGSEQLDCTFCGECIAVCPVGALVSSEFQYTANAWELEKIPATCAHCSGGCALHYEVKTAGALTRGEEQIFRVTNNYEYSNLCGAGRFGFDFDVKATKDESAFGNALAALSRADAIRFNSVITNEEALILQRLKEKLGVKLFNEDARRFGRFMDAYASVSGKRHYGGSLDAIRQAEAAIVIGGRITTDNPAVRYALTTAARHNGARITYLHPIEDALLQNTATMTVRYEVGTEEGVMALIAQTLLQGADMDDDATAFIDGLDEGYLSAESNVGDDELAAIAKSLTRARNRVLVLGSDVIAHERSENIARIAALIEKYTEFSLVVVPGATNTLGASLICDLDIDSGAEHVVGYNAAGSFVLGTGDAADLKMPAMNQQEGTLVSIDNRVLPTNVGIGYGGYVLNDLAAALGVRAEYTVDYTPQLPEAAGFKPVAFDDLENFHAPLGEDVRGYLLENVAVDAVGSVEAVEDLPEFNGTVVYRCNPVNQFNANTAKASQLAEEGILYGSEQFAVAAKISDGDVVTVETGTVRTTRTFRVDATMKGTVALNPTFDLSASEVPSGTYRFEKAKIYGVSG
jgi:NADH-quinone oxidoreductase subunit G